jgi:hypothetical protein
MVQVARCAVRRRHELTDAEEACVCRFSEAAADLDAEVI